MNSKDIKKMSDKQITEELEKIFENSRKKNNETKKGKLTFEEMESKILNNIDSPKPKKKKMKKIKEEKPVKEKKKLNTSIINTEIKYNIPEKKKNEYNFYTRPVHTMDELLILKTEISKEKFEDRNYVALKELEN